MKPAKIVVLIRRLWLCPLVLLHSLPMAWKSDAASVPLVWRWSNPGPHGNNIVEMAYQNGLAIQLAERGQIYTTSDWELWLPRESHTTNALRSLAFFGDRTVITGEKGTVLFADSFSDIRSGTLLDGPTSDWLEGVAASPNLLVAVGDTAAVYTSTDGESWRRQSPGFGNWLRSVAYGGGLFVAVGEGGLIAASADGVLWQKRTSGTTQHLNKVAWIQGRFYAVGDGGTALASSNTQTWQSVRTGATNSLFSVVGAGNNSLLVVGDNEVRLQENSTWSNQIDPTQPSAVPGWTYYCAIALTNYFLIGGRTGVMVEGFKTNSGPYSWSSTSKSIRNWLWDVTRANNLYVAVGDHATVLTSDNGIDWSLESVPDSLTNSIFLGVGGTTNLLVAAGDQGSLMFSANTFVSVLVTNTQGTNTIVTNEMVNTFGVLWNAVEPRPTTKDLQGVASLGQLLVVSGDDGTVLTSSNGTNWTLRSTPATAFLSSVASFPGGLVAVGDAGTILTSPDGVSWSLRSSGTTDWIYRVRYLGGTLIAVGRNGTILTSADGSAWTSQTSGTTHWLNDTAWIAGAYFVAGAQGTLLTSANATTWSDLGTITQKSLYGLANDGARLVAVGIEGVILRSQVVPLLDPITIRQYSRHQTQPDQFENFFFFSGQPDQRFDLDYSGNLTHWLIGPQLEFFDSTGTLLYLESRTNGTAMEYYRATIR